MIYTLNEMVSQILSALDGDEITSIEDTVEAMQVANLIKGVYYDIATDLGVPEHETLFKLNESGDTLQPVLMTVPSNVTRISSVKYDNKVSTDTYSDFLEVKFLPFQDFYDRQQGLNQNTSDVGEMTYTNNVTQSFKMMYWTDRFPSYYTSTDDYTLIFDAYDSSEESYLQKANTQCQGSVYPTFVVEDAFTPDLDPTGFSYLINKAKTRAFMELKQMANQESAAESRRQKIINQKLQRRVEDVPQLFKAARFGRRGPSVGNSIERKLRNGS